MRERERERERERVMLVYEVYIIQSFNCIPCADSAFYDVGKFTGYNAGQGFVCLADFTMMMIHTEDHVVIFVIKCSEIFEEE